MIALSSFYYECLLIVAGALGVFFFFGGFLYFVIISPALCKYWIIPKIEKRYQKKVIFEYCYDNTITLPWIGTGAAEREFCYTIVAMYFGWDWSAKNERQYNGLYKINYDIKTATKAELILAFTTFLSVPLAFTMPFLIGYLMKFFGTA